MSKLSDDQLSQVEDFTVGRHNLGEVKFLGKTDVRGLNLDILVIITEKHAEVYPEDRIPVDSKPPVGTELNKPAEISLLNVRPKQGADVVAFRRKLEKVTKKFGAEMIDYLPQLGKWIFKV
jgi:nuclear pore complex protein Nup98-Nup96